MLIESLFIGILCFDLLKMDASTNREYEAAKLSQNLGLCMRAFSKVLNAISDFRRNKNDPKIRKIAEDTQKDFDGLLDPLIAKMSETGSDRASLNLLRKSSRVIFELYGIVDDPLDPEEKQKLKLSTSKYMASCYTQFTHQLKHLKSLVVDRKPERPITGMGPAQLLQLSAVLNLLYLLVIFNFVERSVSRPLTRLNEDCELIRQRRPIKAGKRPDNEIGTLQDSFVMMSEQVVENEKRRKSYIVLLQSVQLKALNNVRNLLARLKLSRSMPEKAAARLSKSISSVSTLEELLQSMTEQLESEPGKSIAVNYQRCSSQNLTNQLVSSLDSYAQSRQITLELEPIQDDIQFEADPQLISRVLLNLMSNAIKYSPDGAKVEISCRQIEKDLHFCVTDHGPGITAEGQSKLFQRFSQLEAVDGIKRAGTGLGLAICKDFVEAHGGSIACRSTAGQGSTFWFSIPLAKSQGRDLQVEPNSGKTDRTPNRKIPALASIKTGFLFLLLAFVVSQAILFFSLNSLLSQSTKRNEFYVKQKELLFDTEDLFMSFVRWENRMQRAALTLDLQLFKNCLIEMRHEELKVRQLMARTDRASEVYTLLQRISSQEKDLIKLMLYGLRHASEILASPDEMAGKVEKMLGEIDTRWSKVLDAQNSGYQSSYDFSRILRNQILIALLFAAVTDLALIGGALYVGLNLVGKVLILKSKAETFAAGGKIEASLKGKDELCFLDRRLCEVAQEIRDAEAKRKELLAVINHDLRTPLTAILGTMENVKQGVFGELSNLDLEAASLALSELEKLLTQINDLLLLEKLESRTYTPELEKLSLPQVFASAESTLHSEIQAKQLRISAPEVKENELAILADKQLSEKILQVLLKNAVYASDVGGSIGVEYCHPEGDCAIQIDNGGRDIPEELRAQLFNRFRFLEGKAIGGFGLPLAAEAAATQSAGIQHLQMKNGRSAFRVSFRQAKIG